MSIADELRKLQELHQNGALTDAEFAQAKARILAGQSVPDAEGKEQVLRERIAELKHDSDLARLDREWDRERERYQMTGQYGNRWTPTKGAGIVTGVIAVAGGTMWMIFTANIVGGIGGAAALFPLFGLIFIVGGLGIAIYTFSRASQYEQAQQRYQQRRAMILAGEGDDDLPHPAPHRPSSTAIQDLTEPSPCLGCGKTIPAGESRCPHCGWSYS